jgi:hypothetical protein
MNIASILAGSRSLKRLTFDSCDCDGAMDSTAVENIAEYGKTLTDVMFFYEKYGSHAVRDNISCLSELPCLRKFAWCCGARGSGVSEAGGIQMLQNCHNLQHLMLSYGSCAESHVTDATLKVINSSCQNLVSLVVEMFLPYEEEETHLTKIELTLPKLEHLTVGCAKIDSLKGLDTGCPSLRALELQCNLDMHFVASLQIDQQQWEVIANCRSIEYLNISCNSMWSEQIAQVLQNPKLKRADLNYGGGIDIPVVLAMMADASRVKAFEVTSLSPTLETMMADAKASRTKPAPPLMDKYRVGDGYVNFYSPDWFAEADDKGVIRNAYADPYGDTIKRTVKSDCSSARFLIS